MQRGALFLHAARVGQQHVGMYHQRDHGRIVLGRHQQPAATHGLGHGVVHGAHGLLHGGVGVQGPDHGQPGFGQQNVVDGTGDLAHGLPVFPPVGGHEHQAAAARAGKPVERRHIEGRALLGHAAQAGIGPAHGIDHGVADLEHALLQPLAAQIGHGPGRGREVPGGQLPDEAAVHFLGEGLIDLPRPQPCLDVPHGNALVERGECRHGRAAGVAVHQHGRGTPVRELGSDDVEQLGRERSQPRLPALQRQAGVGHEAKEAVERQGHLLVMLAGMQDPHGNAQPLQTQGDRGHLDDLGPCAHGKHDRRAMKGMHVLFLPVGARGPVTFL